MTKQILKSSIALILFVFISFQSHSQSGQWIWMKGENTPNSLGNYGTKGVSSPTNEPHGRYQCAYWLDLQGNFWIFGGAPLSNDMWKFNPVTSEWTWMNGPQLGINMAGVYGTKGVPSPLNFPPATGYGANCWTDLAGDLWLHGGVSATGPSDNLWRYHIATNEWTWMNGSGAGVPTPINYGPLGIYGSAYTPSSRHEIKSGWRINNELWFF